MAKGWLIDDFPPPGVSASGKQVSTSGEYKPWRVEGWLRVALTPYIDLDFGGGWRDSQLLQMDADYGLANGSYPVPTYDARDPQVLKFDLSGAFYGAGITLKNPYGGN